MNVQLNYYKDEAGEYTEPLPIDLSGLNELIHNNWPNESQVEDLKTILITENERFLILKNGKKGVFEVYYTEDERRFYHKKSRIELVNECTELFMTARFSELKQCLNQKRKKKNSPIHDFFISHSYSLNSFRNRKELLWFYTMGLPIGLAFLVIPGVSIYQGTLNALNDFLMLLIFILRLFLWLPGILLHRQYYRDNQGLTIGITKGSDIIEVNHNGQHKTYSKTDLIQVHKFTYSDRRLNAVVIAAGPPWSHYGYTELKFKNGDIINLTNLIMNQLFIQDKFRYDPVKKLRSRRVFPFISHPTNIT